MQTVLDIIRHYNGAGEEDNMKNSLLRSHECMDQEKEYAIEIYIDGWWLIKRGIVPDRIVKIKCCPFCEVKL